MGLISLLSELRLARDETIVRTHVTTAADMLLKDRGHRWLDVLPARNELAQLLEGYVPRPDATAPQLYQDPCAARLAEHQWRLHVPLSAVTVAHRANHFIARVQDIGESLDWLGSTPAPSQQVREAANVLAVYNRLHPHERDTFLDLVAIARHSHRPHLSERAGNSP